MEERVNRACGRVIDDRKIFPERVREAASRLSDFFGERRFGSIGRDDFRAYVEKNAERPSGTDDRPSGSPSDRAGFDILILGTIAGFAGEIALWDLIQTWTEETSAAIKGALP
jgi:hypothetical protein